MHNATTNQHLEVITDKTLRGSAGHRMAFSGVTFLTVSSGAVYLNAEQIKDDLVQYGVSKGFAAR